MSRPTAMPRIVLLPIRLLAGVTAALCLFVQPHIAAGQNDPRDFQLQPAPTPTGQGNVQGPVDEAAPIRPRTTPRPQPAPTPIARPTANPATPPAAAPAPRPAPSMRDTQRAAPGQTMLPTASTQPGSAAAPRAPVTAPPADLPAGPDITAPLGDIGPDAGVAPAPTTAPGSAAPAASTRLPPAETGFPWWLAILAAVAAVGAGGYALWRRQEAKPLPVPEFVPAAAVPRPVEPVASAQSAPTPDPAPTLVPARPALAIEAEAVKLTRSLMAVTLDYRLRIVNRSAKETQPLAVLGDLVSAHGGLPVEQQMADGSQPLPSLAAIPALAAGESHVAQGQIRLPLQQVTPIRQGSAPLFVPLLRLRLEGGGQPVIATYVVGARQPGSTRLQPFRLDETPQSYSQIGQRALG